MTATNNENEIKRPMSMQPRRLGSISPMEISGSNNAKAFVDLRRRYENSFAEAARDAGEPDPVNENEAFECETANVSFQRDAEREMSQQEGASQLSSLSEGGELDEDEDENEGDDER